MNPLHRFHRVPVAPRFLSQDATPDLVKIANMALDRISALYPTFKKRLRVSRPKKERSEVSPNDAPKGEMTASV
jgi:hypothetical protein